MEFDERRKQIMDALRLIEDDYRRACKPLVDQLLWMIKTEPRPYVLDAKGKLSVVPRASVGQVPQEVLDAERLITEYFKRQNVQSWELGDIRSRD